jgi:replicative DNA helicase
MQEKLIPQNIEAEQNVLSALLIDKKAINTIAEKLKPEDFYRISHQIIYRAILSLYGKNEPIDIVTVVEELKKMEQLEAIGNVSYITLLANIAPTAANVKWHAQIVAKKAALRQMVESGTAIATMGYEGSEDDIQSLIDQAEKSLLSISYRKSTTDFIPIQDIVATTIDRISNLIENREAVTGLPTGFTDLDYITAGLQPSDFIILAARPSMGKTALALNIAENVALRGAKEGETAKRVAFFSLEMSRDQLVQRMICTEADIESQELRPSKVITMSNNNIETEAEMDNDKIYKAYKRNNGEVFTCGFC